MFAHFQSKFYATTATLELAFIFVRFCLVFFSLLLVFVYLTFPLLSLSSSLPPPLSPLLSPPFSLLLQMEERRVSWDAFDSLPALVSEYEPNQVNTPFFHLPFFPPPIFDIFHLPFFPPPIFPPPPPNLLFVFLLTLFLSSFPLSTV